MEVKLVSYYNRDCKRLSINKKNMDYLKMGGCANIWHDSNIVFKEYFCDISGSPKDWI